MSIQSSIVTALAAVASGRVYPGALPKDGLLPAVVYRRIGFEPVMTLQGPADNGKSTFLFECYADSLAVALSLATDVITAITAYAPLAGAFREQSDGEEYIEVVDVFQESVIYSFWHL